MTITEEYIAIQTSTAREASIETICKKKTQLLIPDYRNEKVEKKETHEEEEFSTEQNVISTPKLSVIY